MSAENENIVSVLEYRVEEAEEALAKLNKKATRYGSEAVTWEKSEPYAVEVLVDGHKTKVNYVDFEFSTLAPPRVGDFEFIAKLEVTPEGTIVDAIPGETLPLRFRNATNECEHCKVKRNRKHLFVVRNSEKELVQVGKTCLRDYMGTDTPASVAARFRFEKEFREFVEGQRVKVENAALEVLAITNVAIRCWGWVAKSAPEGSGCPTAFKISVWFNRNFLTKPEKEDLQILKDNITEEDWEKAQKVLEWVASEESGNSDYMHNLRLILAPGYVPLNRQSYACSAVAAYDRAVLKKQKQETAKKESTSRHIGKIGERLRGLAVRVLTARGMESNWGVTVLYKFEDKTGNIYSWFSSSSKDLEVGDCITIDGTVKEHKEFNGILETQITRGKVYACS